MRHGREPTQNLDEADGTRNVRSADVATTYRRVPTWTSTAAAGLVGFIAGAVFWHMVGFWSLVSEVMMAPAHDVTTASITRPETVAVRSATNPGPTAATGASRNSGNPAPSSTEILADLIQCTQARKSSQTGVSNVKACPPLRERLKTVDSAGRVDRALSAQEAADRLANGWATGVSQIETGSIKADNR